MKRCLLVFAAVLLLSGCAARETDGDRAARLQERYASMSGCTARYEAAIAADAQMLYYTLDAVWTDDETRVTVAAPEALAGITAVVHDDDALSLAFDGMVLDAGSLDPEVNAVNAFGILLRAAAQGCIVERGREMLGDTEALRLCFETDCAHKTLRVAVWFDAEDMPRYAEIARDDQILAYLEFTEFHFRDTIMTTE